METGVEEGNDASGELSGKLLPGLQADEVIQEAHREDHANGRQHAEREGPTAGDEGSAAKGRKVQYGESANIGKEERHASNARDWVRVGLAGIGFVYEPV